MVENAVCVTRQDEMLAKKINARLKRIFGHDDFYDETKFRKILGPMPNLESYIENRRKVRLVRDLSQSMPDYLRVCYEEPLLTREQETHLLRRYNFHKFRAKQFLDEGELIAASLELKSADAISRTVAAANVRCAVSFLRGKLGGRHQGDMLNNRHHEDLLSEAIMLVVKAVDYIDWTRNVKLVTYITWTLQRTMSRIVGKSIEYDCKHTSGEEFELMEAGSSGYAEESRLVGLKDTVDELMRHCGNSREKEILMRRFFQEETLQVIAESMGITKERVRQIEAKALARLRVAAKGLGYNYESVL